MRFQNVLVFYFIIESVNSDFINQLWYSIGWVRGLPIGHAGQGRVQVSGRVGLTFIQPGRVRVNLTRPA